jgi:hypothetical protein
MLSLFSSFVFVVSDARMTKLSTHLCFFIFFIQTVDSSPDTKVIVKKNLRRTPFFVAI